MDGDASQQPPAAATDDIRSQQVDNALRAIQEKQPVPEIDFTLHTMDDETQVSTLERVCKGIYFPYARPNNEWPMAVE